MLGIPLTTDGGNVTRVNLIDRVPGKAQGDVLVVGLLSVDKKAVLAPEHNLPAAAVASIEQALDTLKAKGTKEELTRLTGVAEVSAPVVIAVGLGEAPVSLETLRRAAGVAAGAMAGRDKGVLALPTTSPEEVAAVLEGAMLGAYTYTEMRGDAAKADLTAPVAEIDICTDRHKDRAVKAAASETETVTRHVRWSRDLVNMPPNKLYPETFSQIVTAYAASTPVSIDVMEVEELEAAGCGGVLGVGMGSGRPPRIVVMRYSPRKARKHVALVGKGITFDSGGLCIKPGGSMVTMKCDMAGAAAVAAAVMAVAELGLDVAVTGYLCLAENMLGDLAQRPGDVVTIHDGKTVEIINTDAEGRLVMIDGIALASDEKPDLIVDVATLTGAAVVALGNRTAAVFSNRDELREQIVTLASEAGEPFWGMPIPEEVRKGLDSEVADIKHIGAGGAGASAAACFLQEFVGKGEDGEQIAWAHLDIAGPAFAETAFGYTGKGGTGFSVRTLVKLVAAQEA